MVNSKKFGELHKEEVSLFACELSEMKPSDHRNSIQDDLADMADLVKHNFIDSNNLLGSDLNI